MKRTIPALIALATLCFFVLLTGVLASVVQQPRQWQPSEMIQPQELIIRIRDNGPAKPLIISVGFPALYRSGHIPGAVFGGPASTPAGLDTLKRAVEKVPKDREIVSTVRVVRGMPAPTCAPLTTCCISWVIAG